MDKKADFFQKKFSNTRSFTRQRETSRIWIWIIVILFILVWWLVCWKVFWAPANLDGYELENDHNVDFSLGEEVYVQWEIKEDRDFATHTHKLNDWNYWEIWLKSDSINLSDYAGLVELTGIVEKFYQWNPIVKVSQLSGTKLNEEYDVDMVLDNNSDYYYMSKAGIQFLPSFFESYLLKNDWENGEIVMENIESWKEIVLSYFRCNPVDPDRNCKGLAESFANNNAQSFVTSEWDVYYKQSDAQSRFVSNGDWWGIFINDVSDDIVYELKDSIKFVNEKTIKERVNFRAMKVCQWEWEKLQNVKSYDVNLKQEWLVVTVSWDWNEKQMTCQILVDFNLPTKWELQSLSIWDNVVALKEPEEERVEEDVKPEEVEEEKVEAPISATSLDTNVPQFPIKEEWLEYKSSRWWYILKFPSSNISYSVSSVKENFGRDDVKCSYVINVIKYSDKENLEVSPSVRIYECDWSVDKSWAQGIVVYPRLDKKFIVQMNDGAWNDFSMNLKFEELAIEE